MQPLDPHGVNERARWAGRLAALFFAFGGTLGLLTLPLLPPDAGVGASAVVSGLAVAAGIAVWRIPWERLSPRATLWLLPPAFALIAAGNAAGGSGYFSYPVFFLLVFVWLGLMHPPRTSVVALPLAAVAYLVPLGLLPGPARAAGVASAAVVLPVCVLVAEALSRSIDRMAATEMELHRERAIGERLRQVDRMRDTFMRAASHELRTPVTVCRGHLEILEPDATAQELEATRALVIGELARMERLIGDITTLSRLEDPEGLDRRTLPVEEVVRSVAVKAEAIVGHAVEAQVEDPGSVAADRQRLEQALLGLVQNVHDHAGPGAKVEIRAERDRHAWRFDVMDDGVGVSPSVEEELFQPFRHGPGSGGSGLGLAIVRSIARAHGGEAYARRRRPSGTTISLRIPA